MINYADLMHRIILESDTDEKANKLIEDIFNHYCPNVNRIKSTVCENRLHDHYTQLM